MKHSVFAKIAVLCLGLASLLGAASIYAAPIPRQMVVTSPPFSVESTPDVVETEGRMPKFPVAGERAPVRIIRVLATAYSSDPHQTDSTPCLPAMESFDLCRAFIENGLEDTIAANFLRLGTKVRFPDLHGGKVFTVRDRLNARYNYENLGYYRIDFYKAAADENGDLDRRSSKAKAVEFGVKRGLKMEILGA